MIPLKDCKPGYLYRLRARNILYGVYNGKQSFIGIRDKFNNQYLDAELHYEASRHFGTATPLEELVQCPIEDLRTNGDTECGECGAKMKYVHWGPDNPRPDGNTFPGKWQHLDKPECGKLDPCSNMNRPLFDWLQEQEQTLRNKK